MQEAVPVNVGAMAAVLGAEVDLINEVINKNKSSEGVAMYRGRNFMAACLFSGVAGTELGINRSTASP